MAKTIRLRAVNFEPVLGDKPVTAAKIKAVIELAARDRRKRRDRHAPRHHRLAYAYQPRQVGKYDSGQLDL